jgi:hypothetical protein
MVEAFESHPGEENLRADVLRLILKKAERIQAEHADQMKHLIFVEKLNFKEIAQRLIPEDCEKSVGIASAAVRKAAKKILGDEYKKVVQRNLTENGKKNKGKTAQAIASLKVRGLSPWSDEERDRLKELVAQPEYQYQQKGQRKGKPICEKIALALNLEFYGKRPARSTIGIRGEIANFRKKSGVKLRQYIDWEKISPTLLQLLQEPEITYPTTVGFGRGGKPNLIKISAKLHELFPDQPVIKPYNICFWLSSQKNKNETQES